MINYPLETDVRSQVDERLKNLGWILDINNPERNVFLEQPKTTQEKKKLKGKRPDYVLYQKDTETPLIVIETKKRGENIEKALMQGAEYAHVLNAPIVFATDGVYYKSLHTKKNKPLIKNGEEIDELIRELLALKFLQEDSNEVNTLPEKVIKSRQELITIFNNANNILRVEGLRAGIERFSEFANILFLKIVSEIDNLTEKETGRAEFNKSYKWDFFKKLPDDSIIDYINNVVLNNIANTYNDKDIFTPLRIRNGKTLKRIISELDPLLLTDINSDVKGDAFEYFLKATNATGNDLGEYFTPRHIVKTMVKLVNPQIGEKIYDPFCGTGGMLIESFKHISQNMYRSKENWDKLRKDTIFGNEITNTARITKMNMILAGDGHSNINMINSLANVKEIQGKYDIVLTNMPYSQTTEFGHLYDLPTKNGDSISVQHMIKSINATSPNGRMAIVVPEGFLFRRDLKKTREYLLDRCKLQTVISLPQGVFLPYTGVKTNILYCTEVNSKRQKQEKVWYFDVKSDGYSLDNNRRKLESKNDIDNFLAYRNVNAQEINESLSVGFNVIDIEEIKKNDFVLSGNRYKELYDYSNIKYSLLNLGEIAEYINGYAFKPSEWSAEGKKIIRIQNLTNENKKFNFYFGDDIPEKYIVNRGDLLISWSATIGFYIWNNEQSYLNQHIFKVIPNEKIILKDYLFFVRSKLIELIESKVHGGTMKHITRKIFEKIKIPIPPIKIQKEIIYELKSYYNIQQNANSIVKNYYPSFPIINENSYINLEEVCEFSGGTQPPKSTFKYVSEKGYIRLLQIRDYKSNENAVYIPKTERHKICEKDDIMIGRYGPPVFQILRGKEGAYNVALIKCIPDNDKITNDWLYYFLSSKPIQEHIISLSERSRQAGVSPKDLKKLQIPLPSIEEQEKIVAKIKEEEKLIEGNKMLVKIFENKITERINNIWGK